MHLLFNASALVSLGLPLMFRFGPGVNRAAVRFGLLYGLSGLCAAVTYLAYNPSSSLPMVGASGAICGLWGALSRYGPGGAVLPLRSRQVMMNLRNFALMNLVMVGMFWVLSSGHGGLAWEAHVGGYALGLLLAPRLVDPSATDVRAGSHSVA